jgi:transposase InsO family protein
MEIIRLVESSEQSISRTLQGLGIRRSTFYGWYGRYVESGLDGLADNYPVHKQFWNAIPPWEKKNVVETALEHAEMSPRQLAWHITDTCGYFISESSVYRILKVNDLITSPAYMVLKAKDKFDNPTTGINQLWQIDFTYFKIVGWGWYYLVSVLDDYSRYIIAWNLCTNMDAESVKAILREAIKKTGVKNPRIKIKPRLLTDNGPCFISGALKEFLENENMPHTRCRPYHPMTQGKIERYHRSMKSILLLDNYYLPEELSDEIRRFIGHYNEYRYHESLQNVTPADVYYGRDKQILEKRAVVKENTFKNRKRHYRKSIDASSKKEYLIEAQAVS